MMKRWQDLKQVFFVGIGGIGMSALARHFASAGWKVAGYDRSASPVTEALEAEGIPVLLEDNLRLIPKEFKDIESTLVVYTPAVPLTSEVLGYFQSNDFYIHKRSEVLGWLTEDMRSLAVAGTHGKTTTSTLLAHILIEAGMHPTAFLGGISANYNTNFIRGKGKWMVLEADEYDRSFLHLHPLMAVITAIEPDHLDIYRDESHFRQAFEQFASQVQPEGHLVTRYDLNLGRETYGLEVKDADFHGENIRVENGQFVFDMHWPDGSFSENIRCGLPGRHNVENAVAAASLAFRAGISKSDIAKAIGTFKGVRRRFETIVQKNDLVYIDDYAHHPTELKAIIHSVRELYPERHLTVVFQPHLFSRTKDFMNEFAEVLASADDLILMDIYPAREEPIPGITSKALIKLVNLPNKTVVQKKDLVEQLAQSPREIILTAGAGDIDRMVQPIKKWIDEQG